MGYYFSQSIQNTFINSQGNGGVTFLTIGSINDFYTWMEGPVVNGLMEIQQNNQNLFNSTSFNQDQIGTYWTSGQR